MSLPEEHVEPFQAAYQAASLSCHPINQTGAVICVGHEFVYGSDITVGEEYIDYLNVDRSEYLCSAISVAIYNAVKSGKSTAQSAVYCTGFHSKAQANEAFKAIALSGIRTLYVHDSRQPSLVYLPSLSMIHFAGIEWIDVSGKVFKDDSLSIRCNGQRFYP